ncbi:MAG: translation initiation factor IF-3 [Planctomycetota bacterium]|nr:translation initiation factor IF-3 [Planctomycetota bacterium]
MSLGQAPTAPACTSSSSEVSAIAKGRYQAPVRDTGKRLRVNDLIRISPIFLISEDNEKVGSIELDKAKQLAREAGLDLVEVSPNSRPPVCRIMDYGKWKYQQKKKEQKARSHSKQSELKEVRLRPKIDTHDLEIKTTRAREFLGDGDKVQFTVLFRGREMAHQDIGLNTLRTIRDALVDASKVESEPRTMGKRMTMILAPDRKSTKAGDHKPAAPATGAAPAAPAAPRVVAPRPAITGPTTPAAQAPAPPAPAAPAPAPAAPDAPAAPSK